jgi:ubiquinone/menaquinone biosynthesis C-methylase UbiE/uncharacterized protein YbaR (Trm112 family)
MLGALAQRLICPSCKERSSNLRAHTFAEGSNGHIRDGVLVCDTCHEWYPIDDDVLEFVPPDLLYHDDALVFQQRFISQLAAIGCKPHEIVYFPDRRHDKQKHAEQRKQREHFDRYAESIAPGFQDYTRSVFIRAASSYFIDLWKAQLNGSQGWILDIGCGTGINSFPIADRHVVAAFDISKKVIRRDTVEARARGMMANTTFFVADGEFLCFKDESFQFLQTFGALHHLPNPAETIKDILRILKTGGVYFGVENNLTSLRWIFDFLMRIKPLWVEEAGAAPLISESMLRDWTVGLPADVYCQTSVFLPPHLFNTLPFGAARILLSLSDRTCLRMPWLKRNGGQLVYNIHKTAPG